MLQRLHTFIRDIVRKNRSGFVRNDTITEAINMASTSLFNSLVQKMRSGGGESYLLQPFRKRAQLAKASGYWTLTGGMGFEVITIESTDEGSPQILLTPDGQFPSTREMMEFEHIIDSEQSLVLTSTTSGKLDLPDDFGEPKESFYHNYNGNRYEGHILDDNSFMDRRNSFIQPPDEEHPIARITDDQIEFYPIPTGSNTFSITLPYKQYNPLMRYEEMGNDIRFYSKPDSFSDQIYVYYLERPALAQSSDGALVNGVPGITVDTELNWGESAIGELASRALIFVGVEVNNQMAAQIEQLTEQMDVADANN